MSEPMPEASELRRRLSGMAAKRFGVSGMSQREVNDWFNDEARACIALLARLREAAPADAGGGGRFWTNPAPDASPVRSPIDSVTMQISAAPAEEVGELVERHAAWLKSYAHDLMEDGDFDQEAARLNEAADAISRLQAERDGFKQTMKDYLNRIAAVATRADAAEQRVADLEREIAEILHENNTAIRVLQKQRDTAEARLDAAALRERAMREALTCLWIIADDDHPKYPGEHNIDTVMKMVRAALAQPTEEASS